MARESPGSVVYFDDSILPMTSDLEQFILPDGTDLLEGNVCIICTSVNPYTVLLLCIN